MTPRDRQRLKGVHPDLVKVVERAEQLTAVPFFVIQGLRTLAEQKINMASGASWTMNSRHLTGHAVDLGALDGGKVSWSWPLYYRIADAMKQSAKELGVAIAWGGDWKKPRQDGPHFELSWKAYPK